MEANAVQAAEETEVAQEAQEEVVQATQEEAVEAEGKKVCQDALGAGSVTTYRKCRRHRCRQHDAVWRW
jgi:hypothetical protein